MGSIGEADEFNTPIDRDQLDGLHPSWISTQSDLNLAEAENIAKALRWLRRKRPDIETVLTSQWQSSLHQKMFGDVWKWAGTWRSTETNIGVDFWLVPERLKELNENFKFQFSLTDTVGHEVVVDFHHQIVSIHPFPNGNGRHGRAIADLLCNLLELEPLSWGASSITNEGSTRSRYVEALQQADQGNLAPLVKFARGQ